MGREDTMTDTNPTAADSGTITIGGDLTVHRLGFGAMRITGDGIWGPPPDRDAAIAVLRRAIELGIDFIDTADSYGPEVSEELIADALHPYPDGLVIATKAGLERPGPGHWTPNGRPDHIRAACDGSLERLRLERIPLYQFHRPDPDVPYEESIGTMIELQQAGKVQHIGVSNVTVDHLRRARDMTPIVSVQNRFNLGDRKSDDVLAACEADGLAFLPWAPIQDHEASPATDEIASRHGVDRRQVVLAWLLARSPVMVPIPGTGSVAHLESNVASVGIELNPDEVESLSAESRQ
jgi:aryl-alcohol dehydrogenase-like predicted oxidoreductase